MLVNHSSYRQFEVESAGSAILRIYEKRYSPQHPAIPHLLVTTGFDSPRCNIGNRQMVAKLREPKTDDHLYLLCTDAGLQVAAVNRIALNRTKA